MDIDLEAKTSNELHHIRSVVAEICNAAKEPDVAPQPLEVLALQGKYRFSKYQPDAPARVFTPSRKEGGRPR